MRPWEVLAVAVLIFCLAGIARADDYENSEQAANARHANNFLKQVYGRP